jgi:hypothetical protein
MIRATTGPLLTLLVAVGLVGSASATLTGDYNFRDAQHTTYFTDVRRGAQINDDGALDLGGTGHTALNFTGSAGLAGDTWLTKWTPGGRIVVFGGECTDQVLTSADILIHRFNNRKGAGVVTFLNHRVPGDKGLALILQDSGNTDTLQLATIDPFTGKLANLATVALGHAIKENVWYRLTLNVELRAGDEFSATGVVFTHTVPTDPDSAPDQFVSPAVTFDSTFAAVGLESTGQVGIMATATAALVDSSVTNWSAQDNCGTSAD